MLTSARPGSSSEETRARIIAAAQAIYEQNGTRGTTTRLVAERAGVNEATVFRHFGSKQALLLAMREGACGLSIFESVIATLTGDLRSDLCRIATSLVERMYEQRAMMCITLAEDARDEVVGNPEWRGPIEIMQGLNVFFAGQIEQRRMRGEATRLAAFFMGMCFSYVVARKIWNSYVIEPEAIESMVDIFMNGVK